MASIININIKTSKQGEETQHDSFESQQDVIDLTDELIREEKRKDNIKDNTKNITSKQRVGKKIGSKYREIGVCEYLVCRSNSWVSEGISSNLKGLISNLHSTMATKCKVEEVDKDEPVHHDNNYTMSVVSPTIKKRKRKQKWSRYKGVVKEDDEVEIEALFKVAKKNNPIDADEPTKMKTLIKYDVSEEKESFVKLNTNEDHIEQQLFSNVIEERMLVQHSDKFSASTAPFMAKWFAQKNTKMKESTKFKNLTPAESLNQKRLKLVKKSKMDIMLRRQRSEMMKELQKYKEEEVKKIDSDVKGMKRDLLSYMLKEVEEHKREMVVNMEKEIAEEKSRRIKQIELELNTKVYNEKSIQTDKCPETVDEKFDEILKHLSDIRYSSSFCRNMLSKKQTSGTKEIGANASTSKRLAVSVESMPIPQISEPVVISSSLNLSDAPKTSSNIKSVIQSYDLTDDVTYPPAKRTLITENITDLTGDTITAKHYTYKKNIESSTGDDNGLYHKKASNNLPGKTIHYNHFASLQGSSDKIHTNNPHEDRVLYKKSLAHHTDSYYNKKLVTQSSPNVMVTKNSFSNKWPITTENYPRVKNTPYTAQRNITSSNKHSPVSEQDTSSYNKHLLSSEASVILSESSVSSENNSTYMKNLLMSTQLGSIEDNTMSRSSENLTFPHRKKSHNTKPTLLSSQDTALYIKNLLLSSRDYVPSSSHEIPRTKKKSSNVFKHSVQNSPLYTDCNSHPGDYVTNKKMKYPGTVNSAYNIYTYNKNLISSQEGSKPYIDDFGLLTVRKKREISKRVFEMYGPLRNGEEVAEKVQSDPIFMSLQLREKNGLLSCLTRSVAEPLTFSKDLLEELFSREVLSISSCKGSPIKTALDADKLELIRRIVFMALPSDDEDALWDMIQECIDTKCRGILRNMKKKLSKSFEC